MKKKTNIGILVLLAAFLAFGNIYAQKSEEEVLNKGVNYIQKGMFDDAITEFNKAIEMNSHCDEAYLYRGEAYSKKGNYSQAITDYTKAIEINPHFVEAFYGRGALYYIQAITDNIKAIKTNYNFAGTYINNYDLAIADYTKVLEIDPSFSEVYEARAKAYFGKMEYDNAWIDMHKAEELGYKSNDPQFLEDLKKASGREK